MIGFARLQLEIIYKQNGTQIVLLKKKI